MTIDEQSQQTFSDDWSTPMSNHEMLLEELFSIFSELENNSRSCVLKLKKFLGNNKDDQDFKYALDTASWETFFFVTQCNCLQAIKLLLEADADLNITLGGETILHYAAKNSHKEVVETLIDKGAKVNEKDNDGSTPLHTARDIEIIKTLIDKGAKVNEKDNDGRTPLHTAGTCIEADVAKILIRKGANVNEKDSNGSTPLHYAASGFNMQKVEVLIENRADVKAEDEGKQTPLHLAAKNENEDIVKILIKNEAKVNAMDRSGQTPLHIVAQYAIRNPTRVAKILVEKQAEIDAVDRNGQTPLHLAIKYDNTNIVKFLIENGADIDKKDNYGWTPLHYATKKGVEEGNTAIVNYLIEKGAKINVVDKSGRTPLHLSDGDPRITYFLLDGGADPLLENRDVGFLRSLVEIIANDGVVEHWEEGEDEYKLFKYSLLLSNNSSLAHVIKREAFYDLISEWSSDVSGLTEDQKKLNKELLSILVDIPNHDIRRFEKFLQDNKSDNDLRAILNLQRGESKLTVLHVIPSMKDMVVREDMDLVVENFMDLLLKAGADPNVPDSKGQTPLHYTAHSDCFYAMYLLLKTEHVMNLIDKEKPHGRLQLIIIIT